MRPKKQRTTGSGDLFRARLDQIINMKHEAVQLAGKVDWDWIGHFRCDDGIMTGCDRRSTGRAQRIKPCNRKTVHKDKCDSGSVA